MLDEIKDKYQKGRLWKEVTNKIKISTQLRKRIVKE
jgi:hypothetical protein